MLRHEVFIPYDNSKVFGSSRRNRYQRDFVDWILSNFGQVAGGQWGTNSAPNGTVFRFKEPSHAMMFKLIWA